MIGAKKIKAGALQFVLFIGVVIAVLLMTFVLLSHSHSLLDKKTNILVDVIKSTDYGLEKSLIQDFPINQTLAVVNENNPKVALNVSREYWGVFEKRTIQSSCKNIIENKSVLIGGKEKGDVPALYLLDKGRPLILAGSSRITGDAYLPKQGVKMGNISGNSYTGSKLVYGRKMESKSVLPKLSKELVSQIQKMTNGNYMPEGEELKKLPKSELRNSFHNPTLILRERIVRLENISLSGNIVISASQKIIVSSTAKLKDIILIAPEIVIKDRVHGTFQAIANKSIYVGGKCLLQYPSALIVNKKQENNTNPIKDDVDVFIDAYTVCKGFIIAIQKIDKPTYSPQIKINENTLIEGEIYGTGNLELEGSVSGSVTTASFVSLTNGSVYQNHLYKGQINRGSLPYDYVGMLTESKEKNKKIMKWLY